jgi:UDPglucose 6-dehydrogenase/GDP-mannose 6-dehydrogenase
VVIGQLDAKSGKTFAKIYAKVNCPKVFVNLSTAEMTKYAANSLLATLISYSNEIARIAEHTPGVDVLDVWQGVHLDKRWSPIVGKQRIRPGVLNYIFSGAGYGGSCFPKDTKALAGFAEDLGVETPLVNSVISINHTQPHRTVWHLKKALGKNLKGKKIAVLGVAFKPDTDDTRESAAFPIIEMLIKAKAKVFSHDPEVYKRSIPAELKGLPIKIAKTELEAIKGADAVIVVTAWNQYKKLSPQFFKKNMKRPVVVDGRRIYDKNKFLKTGIIYKGIGL